MSIFKKQVETYIEVGLDLQLNNELFSFEDKDENKISNEDFLRLPRREIKTKTISPMLTTFGCKNY